MDTVKSGDTVIFKGPKVSGDHGLTLGKAYTVTAVGLNGNPLVRDDAGGITTLFEYQWTFPTATVSDGSSTDYYKLPEGATDLLDLIDHKAMGFGVGNIFKACYRLGEKSGTDVAYDLRKIIFFANRELARVLVAGEKSTA